LSSVDKEGIYMLEEKEKDILTFLELTKEGTYAEVELSSMQYTRFPFLSLQDEEEYYYYNLR
jgi:hypothetical protein